MLQHKNERTQDSIGKNDYNFDYELERSIYNYMFGIRLKKRRLETLIDDIKFDNYVEWKQYVKNKYKKCTDENLENFSRFLNCRLRGIKPNQEYWNIVSPVLLSMIITQLPEMIDSLTQMDLKGIPLQASVMLVFIILVLISILAYVIWKTVAPIWDNNNDENFILDYKEIIDFLIQERTEKRKKNKDKKTKK